MMTNYRAKARADQPHCSANKLIPLYGMVAETVTR